MRITAFIVLSLVLLSLPAPGADQKAGSAPPGPGSYVIGAGDQVHVRATDAEGFPDTTVRVDDDGYVTLPLAGRVPAAGHSLADLERSVQARLETYFNYAKVNVSLAEVQSRPISIGGSVNTPGIHQIQGRKTLLDVLSLGGGLRPDAGYMLTLTRRGDQGAIPLPGAETDPASNSSVAKVSLKDLMNGADPRLNIEVRPGDIVTVPRGELIYVLGEVRKPGGFVLTQNASMSVIQAISLAEGAMPSGSLAHVRLLHLDNGSLTRRERELDVKKILAGNAPDISMGPDDVLYIPVNRARSVALKTLDATLLTGSGLLIYGRY